MFSTNTQFFPRQMTPATEGHRPVLAIRKQINFVAIHDNRKALESELKEVKTQLRQPHTTASAAIQERQVYLRQEVTAIYSLLAHIRGRQHQTKIRVDIKESSTKSKPFSMEDQERLIGTGWKVYLKMEEAISAPAA